ncbi:hypothetical protein NDU88_005425 [Pleurodeles waltl]|uniref:Uncharacterized protein n=1 Tax=Pleurodeles waltl TaxID=8319 RepID=A0AAV7TBJ0_PLEWA|nr:hypothetical protein NDU88_005425 [Pleurodeles waltl]
MVKGLLGVLTAAREKHRGSAEGDDGWTERRYWGRLETVVLIVFYLCKIKVICAHRPPRILHCGDEVVRSPSTAGPRISCLTAIHDFAPSALFVCQHDR